MTKHRKNVTGEDIRYAGEQLARAHWNYVESVLRLHKVGATEIEIAKKHYNDAFVHGFKHGYRRARGY